MDNTEKLKSLLAELDKYVMKLYIRASSLPQDEYVKAKQTYTELSDLIAKYKD